MSDSVRNAMYYGLNPCFDELYRKSQNGENFVHLMELIGSKENIMLAFRNIKGNKGSCTPGVDGVTIDDLRDLPLSVIINMVRNKLKWYEPKPVRRVEIPKSSDPSKTRPLGIPCMIERLIQQCVKQILEPIAEAKFYKRSYGFRANRSCENAIAEFQHLVNFGKLHYVADVDIKSFFDRVDHGCLMRQLWKMGIHDKKLLAIIKAMLKAPIILPTGEKVIPEKGTPQGAILSPLLSLIVLNDLDWWVANQWENHPFIKDEKSSYKWTKLRKQKLCEGHIIRYADDFKILCRTREDAERWLDNTTKWLKDNLNLEVSPEKSGVTNLRRNYTEFLGLELKVKDKRDQRGPHTSGRKRDWVVTSRVKPKTLLKVKERLETEVDKLRAPTKEKLAGAVRNYNSVVDGLQNYYSIATQINADFGTIGYNLSKRMYHRVEGLTEVKPEDFKPTKADLKFIKSKQVRYVQKQMIHPIGYVQFRIPLMFRKNICNYTESGRAVQGIRLGAEEAILVWLARTSPYNMPIEEADNRISAFSAQKGKCAILHEPLDIARTVVMYKNPFLGKGRSRYRNLLIVSELANRVISEPDPQKAKKLLIDTKCTRQMIKVINKYRTIRKYESL